MQMCLGDTRYNKQGAIQKIKDPAQDFTAYKYKNILSTAIYENGYWCCHFVYDSIGFHVQWG